MVRVRSSVIAVPPLASSSSVRSRRPATRRGHRARPRACGPWRGAARSRSARCGEWWPVPPPSGAPALLRHPLARPSFLEPSADPHRSSSQSVVYQMLYIDMVTLGGLGRSCVTLTARPSCPCASRPNSRVLYNPARTSSQCLYDPIPPGILRIVSIVRSALAREIDLISVGSAQTRRSARSQRHSGLTSYVGLGLRPGPPRSRSICGRR